MQMNVAGEPRKIDYSHQSTYYCSQAGGKSGTHHSPAKFKDENIVEYNIEYGCGGIAHHGIIGRSVQTDEKHACAQ